MLDNHGTLEAVLAHAEQVEADYDDIAASVTALADCGDTTLVPRLHAGLEQFLDQENVYGRDLMAAVLAGIQGVAALPVLLRASARSLGDDQDSLQSEITELMDEDRSSARPAVLELVTSEAIELRRVGIWALDFVLEPEDIELLVEAAIDSDPEVRSMAIDLIPAPAGNEQVFALLVLALRDPDAQVRASAVSRLAHTGRADALAPLTTLITDPAPRVRSLVAYALERLGSADPPSL